MNNPMSYGMPQQLLTRGVGNGMGGMAPQNLPANLVPPGGPGGPAASGMPGMNGMDPRIAAYIRALMAGGPSA